MTAHIIFFSYVLATLQQRTPQLHPTPLSGFANAAQLSEIVCENTTQYSRIMMTLLTPVPGASHKKKKGKKKKSYIRWELGNRKDIFRRIKRPKRPALDTATPQWRRESPLPEGDRGREKSKHDYHIV